jgi:PPE-repeat protein
MSFLTLPPEINSALMFSGEGSAPILEAAAAWDGLASELGSAADSFGSVTAGLVGQAWQGRASAAGGRGRPVFGMVECGGGSGVGDGCTG